MPAACVLVVRGLRAAAGPGWAGRFLTFPGASLALLVATHVEAGPAAAGRLAAAMPGGGLGTLAFLAVFRFGSPRLGLAWGTAAGYAAAIAALLTVEAASAGGRGLADPARDLDLAGVGRWFRDQGRAAFLRADAAAWVSGRPARFGRRSRDRRRFSPRLEALTG
jgi:hypothetical protein